MERSNFRMLQSHPAEALGWIMAIFFIDSLNIILYCTAAQWCPAALSATVNNSANMVVGYLVQVLFFATPLELLTIIGAVLMLISVVSMSALQELAPAAAVSANTLPPQEAVTPPQAMDENEESVTAFAAAEFIAGIPRLRRRGSQIVGGAMAAPTPSTCPAACSEQHQADSIQPRGATLIGIELALQVA